MKIRNEILLYFSTTVIILTVISSLLTYFLFSEFREEEFQQKQKQKIELTINFIRDYKEMSEELTNIMDMLTIHDFYDEKMLIFDKNKIPIYRSIDDLEIAGYRKILNELSPSRQWIETKEEDYDLIGVYIESDDTHFYALSKAYDEAGYSKIAFLRSILIVITIIISIIVLLITRYLSRKISQPITDFAEKISGYNLNENYFPPVDTSSSSYEMNHLTEKFNQLLKRTNEAFDFQKYAVQHISHELKTPISILVSELEMAADTTDTVKKEQLLQQQVVRAKSLGEIIDVLLELSKMDAGQEIHTEQIRLDDLLFEIIHEESLIHPQFVFDIQFTQEIFDEARLSVPGNRHLLKRAFTNLIDNCIKFSADARAEIRINISDSGTDMAFINAGQILIGEEQKRLFQHFFRGQNNTHTKGFGLGLVLTKKILDIHGADIHYHSSGRHTNIFTVSFP